MARKRFVTSEISTDRKIAKLAEKKPVAAALWPRIVPLLPEKSVIILMVESGCINVYRNIRFILDR